MGQYQEGSRFGILLYDAKWETAKAFLIEVDGESGSQTDIKPVLDAGALKSASASGIAEADRMAYRFSIAGIDAPRGDMVINDPLDIRIGYLGEVPKSEDVPSVEGVLKIRLTRTGKGPVAKEIGGAEAPAPAPDADKDAGLDEFRDFRKRVDAATKSGDLKRIKVQRKSAVRAGRNLSYMGDLQANVLERMVYLDSENDENETIIIYYWKEGMLTSVYELREGMDTEISEVGSIVEIYNFNGEKLVSHVSDGKKMADPDKWALEMGDRILADSIERAGVIYAEIGAD